MPSKKIASETLPKKSKICYIIAMSILLTRPAPAHLPESMIASVKRLPRQQRLILFTRHSLREAADNNGFASYKLPLTAKGRVLAKAWGQWLAENLAYSMDVDSISSPIQRCIDTASLMQLGAGIQRGVQHQSLLVEPGSLVVEPEVASKIFKDIGALNFINRFLAGAVPGTKTSHQGGLDLLSLFYQHQPQAGHLLLAVSHDTLLSAFLAVMMEKKTIHWNDWPKMMEGVFLWFDDAPLNQADAHFIWRGDTYTRPVTELIEAQASY